MPRARAPNASFFAGADLPILPFLAPRVFVESPVPRKCVRHHGRKSRTQEKEEKVTWQDANITKQPYETQGPGKHLGREAAVFTPTNAARRTPNTSASLWKSPSSLHPRMSVSNRYAEISTFARQHLRPYSTDRRTIRTTQSYTKTSTSRLPRTSTTHTPLSSGGLTQARAKRREKALSAIVKQLDRFTTDRPRVSAADLFKHGTYRSLRRRIINLRQWDATRIDLTKLGSFTDHTSGLLEAFAALDRSLYLQLRQQTSRITIQHHRFCTRWSTSVFQGVRPHETHRAWCNWMELDTHTRKKAFRPLLIYLLDRKPGRAMQFIHVVVNDPILRGVKTEIIADALGHLSKIHLSGGKYTSAAGWSEDVAVIRGSFAPAFVHAYRNALASQRNACSQDLLYNLVNLTEVEDLKKVFDCLSEKGAYMTFDTVLHYVNTFAQAGEIPYALRCLDVLKASNSRRIWSAMVHRERLRWSCALILRKSMSLNEDYHETPKIIAAIVELGVQLDIKLYNIVMHNAMDAGDYATAFKVYNTLEENGLTANGQTYSILLHGCAGQGDPALFSQFAEHCAKVAIDTKDPWLATDYLYYIYIRHQNDEDKANTLALLWAAYLRFFDPKSLGRIGTQLMRMHHPQDNTIVSLEGSASPADIESPRMALLLVIQALIQSTLVIGNRRVLNLYERFSLLVKGDEHPHLKDLAEHPIIWNTFLYAFCQNGQFASASQVIKEMTENSPQPNVYTWNIFMQAFAKRGQIQAAERVLELMHTRGVDLDQYTYGIALRGFAKAQLVDRVGEMMHHVDSEQEMEPDLLRALAQLVNRKELMVNLEQSRAYKESKAQEEARLRAEEEQRRWAVPFVVSELAHVSQSAELPQQNFFEAEVGVSLSEKVPQGHNKEMPQAQIETQQSASPKSHTSIQRDELSQHLSSSGPQTSLNRNSEESLQSGLSYEQLRERLGLPDDAPSTPISPVSTFGADLGFRTVPSNDEHSPVVAKRLSRFSARKVFGIQRAGRRPDK